MYQKFDNSDMERLNQLKSDIKALQARGILVKLAYGGEEWGNTRVWHKVRIYIIMHVKITDGYLYLRTVLFPLILKEHVSGLPCTTEM